VFAAALGYFVYRAKVEERRLAAAFPDTYPEYRADTKVLIPLVQ
jgi:protein-S-isoprenylcysteine O-methyltransferase Ste14